jgi:hypothetical protein
MKPNPKKINIILNILKGAQFEFLPWTPFYIDTPLLLTKNLRQLAFFKDNPYMQSLHPAQTST